MHSSLDAWPYLKQMNMDPFAAMNCPECKEPFTAIKGFCYPTHYTRNGVAGYGLLAFCSQLCILKWVDPKEECGHG